MMNFTPKANLIWSIAELLRGSWKQHEYQDVILPFTVLKRLDSVLEKTKQEVLRESHLLEERGVNPDPILRNITKVGFYNTSQFTFKNLLDEQTHLEKNFKKYLHGFSPAIQEILEKFDFEKHLSRLWGGNLLFKIIQEFNKVDLSIEATDNHEMGSIFEELIRRFAEQSNDTAGEHYTPREVIKLMVEILFTLEKDRLKKEHLVKTIYDPCCGTGGMLTVGKDHVSVINPDIGVYLFGQEINPATYAICKSEMLIKGEDVDNIKGGEKDAAVASTLSNDQFRDRKFDYLLTNPPFGVDWKRDKDSVERESERGFAGRFGAGLPRISDGQLLFLQHLVSKMQNPSEGGSRMAIVMNGSPLFTGDAGSGESEIRRWILENDWLEAIVALPDQMFFNTGISTYLWFLTNRKDPKRKGRVQLIDARTFFHKMRKSLGNKRNEITDEDRSRVLQEFSAFKESDHCKIFKTTDFAFRQITVERPLRLHFQASSKRIERLKEHKAFATVTEGKKGDEALQKKILGLLSTLGTKDFNSRETFTTALEKLLKDEDLKIKAPLKKAIIESLSERDEFAEICHDEDGNPESDSEFRDTENVPYDQHIEDYFKKEVLPYVPDAWINESVRDHKDNKVGKVGYEIPFTRYFYKYVPPRPLEEIESDMEKVENELLGLLKKL
ncbi:SAM-dependent DNA methyltransferase [Candidatus Peregrinibacteria bacterium]|nr:SAM-dependent DNA methyltransferase [Candidatus Peregrinibacteria bacterium]